MKHTILILITTIISHCTIAQPIYDIKEYTIKDGLAQSIVTGLLQDNKGFMWFGTWDGLNKFDGYNFKKYKSIQGDGSSVINNRLQRIVKSQYEDIWCLTYLSKVYLFDSNTEKFIDVLGPIEAEKEQVYFPKKIKSLPKGIAWIMCDNGYAFRIDEQAIKEHKGITMFSTFNNTLKSGKIYNIVQDIDGDEWIFTNKGVNIVGRKTINSDFPFQTLMEMNGEIWLTRGNGKIAKYDRRTSTPHFIEPPGYMERINGIEIYDDHTLVIAANKGLVLFDTRNHTFKQINILTPTQQNDSVTHLFKDKKGEFWLFTQGDGTTRVNIKKKEVQHLYTPKAEVTHYERPNAPRFFEDAAGTLWILPRNGNLSYYDRESKTLKYYYTDPNDAKTVFHPFIRHQYTDKQGSIWFSSLRDVYRMSPSNKAYEHTYTEQNMEVRAFLHDSRNNLWIASKNGKIRVFDEKNRLKGYLSNDGKITHNHNLFLHNTYCFMEDKDENIWIGTRYDGIYLLRKNSGNGFSYTISNYRHSPKDHYSPSSNSIYDIFRDKKERIWIACYQGGINLISKDDDNNMRFIHYGNLLKNYPSAHALKIRDIAQVNDSVMMAGTTDGLLTFSSEFNYPEEIKFYRNARQAHVNTSIGSSDVMQVFTNREDIYAVTFSGGVNKIMSTNLLSENIEFKAYTERNGLASDLTLSMTKDQKGDLWIVSENALTRFNPNTETFENFDQQLLHDNVYFSEAIPGILSSGQIVLGTNRGIVTILPEEIKKSNYIPHIAFTNLKIQDSDSYPNVDYSKKLLLSPKQRNITLQFAALDFRNSHNIRYAYRLKGLEEKWNYADKNRSASYLNIPKGTYCFEVKSTNSDGVWVDNTRTLTIEVSPTFGETPWALLLYVVLFCGLVWTIVYVLFYIYRLRHRVEIEQQLSHIKIGDYIIKPFSTTGLKPRIETLLKQRQLLQERHTTVFPDKKGATLNVSPSEPQITPLDEIFLKEAVRFVEDNIDKAEMTIDDFANALKVSRTVFYRKLKNTVGLSPIDFVREIRVKRSTQLIDSGEYNFSQIAYMCGFNDPKYFTKCFKKKMGVTPSEYKESRILRN